jgi:uncharacterized protein
MFPTLLKTFFTSALFFLGASSFAAEESPAHPLKPLLWKIEGKDLAKPSYLFGTIHIGGGPLDNLHPAAEKAFQECDTLYTEIPLDAQTQLAMTQTLLRTDNKTLVQSIGEKLKNQVEAELKAINPALDITPFASMKTWVMAVSLPSLKVQLFGGEAIDAILWRKAEEGKKQTSSIETAESQLALFDSFNEEEQIVFLSETTRVMKADRDAKKDSIQSITDAYITGDVDIIKKEMDKGMAEMTEGEHKELGKRLCQKLLTDRDQSMAATIGKKLAEAPTKCHFFAAGAGLYAGEISIRSHLEKQGYKITRIQE